MFKNELKNLGLSEGEADVYSYLLQKGERSAGEIIADTDLKRGNTYNILESLVGKGLVTQALKNKVAHFKVENPHALLELIERNAREYENKKTSVTALMPSLVSTYQLSTNKPVVSYYEGKDGFSHILDDTLTSKTEVLQYADIEIIETRFQKESDDHVKRRGKLNIEKRLIVVDSIFTRNLYASLNEDAVSHVKAIEKGDIPFDVTMYIYDGKVSYTSLIQEKIIAVIIEDINIYNMHRHLFNVMYKKASPIRE